MSFRDHDDNFSKNVEFLFNRVESLSSILRNLENILRDRDLTEQQKDDLCSIIHGCRNVLDDLDKILDEFHSLNTNPGSHSGKWRKAGKRFKWDASDITELRSRVTSNISLLNAFHGSLIR